jgi:hypothetical protein
MGSFAAKLLATAAYVILNGFIRPLKLQGFSERRMVCHPPRNFMA